MTKHTHEGSHTIPDQSISVTHVIYTLQINKGTKVRNQIRNQKQEQFELSESSKELLNTGNDIIDRSTVDKLFQSEGALN